jgi:hypothetical protein
LRPLRRVRKGGRIARRSNTAHAFLGQHLALSLAAHLARTQLVRDPLATYDAQRNRELLNTIGDALARTARLYVVEVKGAQPQELTQAELEGARAKNGATLLVLKDGRTLSGVSVKRGDLQEAIAILKAVGIGESGAAEPGQANATGPERAASARIEELRRLVGELEALLAFPLLPGQVKRANGVAISIARRAPEGRISNLAMHLVSAVHDACRGEDANKVRIMLGRLRAAVEGLAAPREHPALRASGTDPARTDA